MTRDVVHRLVGYDPITERVAFQHDIADSKLGIVKRIARVSQTDPDAVGAYPLSKAELRDLAGILGIKLPREKMDFFLEPFAVAPVA
jgi:hypothetical protein